ncbi:MAG TPA: hypothetical protein DEV81_07085 [Cyanobacteria bacterium UBA11049]|nr:hypothetical protein [Cyanobacteria bacterium UBA11049]
MNPGVVAAIAYGILAIVGGIIGYVQAKSKASLISGIVSGLLLIIAGVVQLQGQGLGLILAIVVTIALIIVFAMRLAKTRKFMPAGLMTALGVAALVVMLKQVTSG